MEIKEETKQEIKEEVKQEIVSQAVPEVRLTQLLPEPMAINEQSRVSEKIERVGRKRRRIEDTSEHLS